MKFYSQFYRRIIATCDPLVPIKFRPLWEAEAGPKTIFFWAPACKWCMVVAGFADVVYMPIEKASAFQTFSIASSALIWSRWSMIIKPRNWTLFSVNSFVGVQQSIQMARIYKDRYRKGKLKSPKDFFAVLVS